MAQHLSLRSCFSEVTKLSGVEGVVCVCMRVCVMEEEEEEGESI